MADEKNLARAGKVYQTICGMLDKEEWKYTKDDEKLSIECGARGEDLPMDLNIQVDAERQLVMVLSRLPYKIAEDKRIDAALAVSVVNQMLVHGCLDYNVSEGHVFFRMTSSFWGSEMDAEAYRYMLYASCSTIDEYNDTLLMLSKGMLTLEKFVELVNK